MVSTDHEDHVAVETCLDPVAQPALSSREWRSTVWVICAAVGLMAFMVRVVGGFWPDQFKVFFPDSFSFMNAAKLTPFSPSFYAAQRPIAFPMLLFVLGRSSALTIVVQTFLYGLAFVFAVRCSWGLLRHPPSRVLGAFLIVRIGLEPRFALWNSHILSESIGMTLALTSVVLWWRFSAGPTIPRLRWASLATIGWLTARDSNVPPWLAVGVPALLVASFWWKRADPNVRRAMRRWAVVTLVVGLGVAATQAANGRNRYATLNNVGERVLPDSQLTSWFVGHGMPMSDALAERAGKSSFDDNWKMLNSADLVEFRAWARNSGQREMLLSYVRFAPHWVRAIGNDLGVLLQSDQRSYDAFKVAQRLPRAPSGQVGGPTTRSGLVAWTVIAIVGVALAARRRGVESVALALLLISSFVDLYMAYVGDSVEVQRHMVGPLSRMAVIMVLCLCVGFDSLLAEIRRHRTVIR